MVKVLKCGKEIDLADINLPQLEMTSERLMGKRECGRKRKRKGEAGKGRISCEGKAVIYE